MRPGGRSAPAYIDCATGAIEHRRRHGRAICPTDLISRRCSVAHRDAANRIVMDAVARRFRLEIGPSSGGYTARSAFNYVSIPLP